MGREVSVITVGRRSPPPGSLSLFTNSILVPAPRVRRRPPVARGGSRNPWAIGAPSAASEWRSGRPYATALSHYLLGRERRRGRRGRRRASYRQLFARQVVGTPERVGAYEIVTSVMPGSRYAPVRATLYDPARDRYAVLPTFRHYVRWLGIRGASLVGVGIDVAYTGEDVPLPPVPFIVDLATLRAYTIELRREVWTPGGETMYWHEQAVQAAREEGRPSRRRRRSDTRSRRRLSLSVERGNSWFGSPTFDAESRTVSSFVDGTGSGSGAPKARTDR